MQDLKQLEYLKFIVILGKKYVYAFRQKQKIGESPISRNSPRFFFILDRADLQGRYG